MTGQLVGAFAVALLTIAGPAAAAHITVTYAGTVSSGSDPLGLWGAAGIDPTGEVFSAQFKFDTSLGGLSHGWNVEEIYGGTGTGTGFQSPATSVTLALGAETFSFDFSEQSFQWTSAGSEMVTGGTEGLAGGWLGLNFLFFSPDIPFGVVYPFVSTTPQGPYGGEVSTYSNSTQSYDALIFLSPQSLTVTSDYVGPGPPPLDPPPVAPEPATWGLLLTGFFGLGAAVRRQRSARATI
jgi:hypothetical protein